MDAFLAELQGIITELDERDAEDIAENRRKSLEELGKLHGDVWDEAWRSEYGGAGYSCSGKFVVQTRDRLKGIIHGFEPPQPRVPDELREAVERRAAGADRGAI